MIHPKSSIGNLFLHRFVLTTTPMFAFWTSATVAECAAAVPSAYYVTDLGTLGGTDSLGWGLNASGQATGYAATMSDAVHPFLWNPTSPGGTSGAMKDLGALGGDFGWGIGINDGGQVAGVASTTDEVAEHASIWIPATPNGTAGTMHDLGTLGGATSQGTGINNGGQVTGYADTTDDEASLAFVWIPDTPGAGTGTMHNLGSLGGSQSIGWDINAAGFVTGDSDTTDADVTHAFLWKPTDPNGATGTMHDLGTFGGAWSSGGGLNDNGQVAGSSTNDNEESHAFLWTPSTPGDVSGTMNDLGTLGGAESYGYNLNSSGHVVGASYVQSEISNYTHAFVYTSASGMVDLNSRIDPSLGWELLDGSEINKSGQITGQGLIHDEYHAYLLSPALPGDVNFDRVVNIFDINSVSTNWGTTGPQGDANGDGIVNIFDINLISANWTPSGGTPVPEPAAWVISLAAIALVATARAGFAFRRKTT
jgi:probable HAF family extracellular repeat protein